jgi:hypothetical protein
MTGIGGFLDPPLHGQYAVLTSSFRLVGCASSNTRAQMVNCTLHGGTFLQHNSSCVTGGYSWENVIENATFDGFEDTTSSPLSPTDDFFQFVEIF